ncbi:MAG: STAS domain-containing protein [Fimbriimonadaceae bacterium]
MIVEASEDVITLSGTLNHPFWESVQTAIALTLNRHPSGVIVDCANITSITEDGAKTFQYAIDYVLGQNARIIFARVPDNVKTILQQTPHVKSQLATAPSVQEARTSLDLLLKDGDGKKKRTSEEVRSRHILAVISPNECDDHFVRQLEQLVSSAPAHLVFLLPIEVPRELPLHAPVPEEEARLVTYGEKVKSAFAKGQNLAEIRLERTRDIPTLIAEVSEEINAEQVIIAIPSSATENADSGKLFESILRNVTRPLMFVRANCGSTAN